MDRNEFIREIKKLGIKLNDRQLNQLNEFYKILIEWNEKINLTTITEEKEVYLKHFYDSLTLYRDIDLNKNLTICDVGTGAGFPGIVLKIVFPNLKVVLIDSLNKRVIYLKDVIDRLGLKDIEAIHTRMEDYSKEFPEKFDLVTARAVANTRVLLEICSKSVKIGGKLIFLKANIEEEIKGIESVCSVLKLKLEKIDSFKLPIENSTRNIVFFTKIEKTPDKYPRNIDKIKKFPL